VPRWAAEMRGAGEKVVAVIATYLAAGGSIEQAMKLANAASGLAVAEVGSVAIDPRQIAVALAGAPGAKVFTLEELSARAAEWRRLGRRIAFTDRKSTRLNSSHVK